MKKPYSVCDLPLESLLKIASYLSFSDLWYFGTSSRSCQKLAHQLVWHKYHIDLARQRINSFNHLIHASIAYVCRHGYDDQHDINHTAIQSVANRLAVEIYDRTPQLNWAPCLDFLLDKALGIMLDHVLYDPSLDPLPHQQHNQGGSSSSSSSAEAVAVAEVAANSNDLPTMLSQGKKQKYASTPMGRLMTTLLVTLYPTLTALFDADPASAIHHRLLLAHISRHLDILTRRYHQQHRRRVSSGGSLPFARTESVRHGFRVLIQFIGNLCQTELMTAADLHILTRQRIIAFFISYQSTTNNNNTSININHHSDNNKKNNATTTTTSTTTTMLNPNNSNNDTSLKISSIQPQKATTMVSTADSSCWRLWMDEIEFQTAVLLDLLRAVVCRQYTRFDSGKELNMFASMLNETVSTLVSCKSSSPSSSPVSTSSSSSLPPTPPASSSSTESTSLSSSLSEPSVPKTTPPPSVAVVSAISPSR